MELAPYVGKNELVPYAGNSVIEHQENTTQLHYTINVMDFIIQWLAVNGAEAFDSFHSGGNQIITPVMWTVYEFALMYFGRVNQTTQFPILALSRLFVNFAIHTGVKIAVQGEMHHHVLIRTALCAALRVAVDLEPQLGTLIGNHHYMLPQAPQKLAIDYYPDVGAMEWLIWMVKQFFISHVIDSYIEGYMPQSEIVSAKMYRTMAWVLLDHLITYFDNKCNASIIDTRSIASNIITAYCSQVYATHLARGISIQSKAVTKIALDMMVYAISDFKIPPDGIRMKQLNGEGVLNNAIMSFISPMILRKQN